jgi:site-specific DNA recombinase
MAHRHILKIHNNDMDNYRYFIYARKSSESEERQARSIEDQLREAWAMAQRLELRIVGEYTEAQTASKPGRPVFADILRRIAEGEADAILAWEPNRLARNSVDGGQVLFMLDTKQLKHLAFVNYQFSNDSHGKFALYMAFAQSKYYSDNLSENIRRGIKSKLERGVYPNQAKRGYMNHPKTREIVPDPRFFLLIPRMFELYASGKYGLLDLGLHVFEFGLAGYTGRPLSASQVQRMLTDPFYYGAFNYKGERFQGTHAPAVSKELWDAAQAMVRNRGKIKPKRRGKYPFAYRGLLRCAECGHAVTAEMQKGHTYYHCSKRSMKVKCTQPFAREELISEQLTGVMNQLAEIPGGWIENMLAEIETVASAKTGKDNFALSELDREQKDIQTRLSRLADLYVGGDLDRAEYNARKSGLIDRKVALVEARKKIAQGADVTKFERLRQPLELILDWKNAPAGSDPEKLHGLAVQVGSNWVLDSRKVLWDWLPHYAPLSRRASYASWRREWDSNPRYAFGAHRFESCVIVRMMRGWKKNSRAVFIALVCATSAVFAAILAISCLLHITQPKGDFDWIISLSGNPPPTATAVARDGEGCIAACGSSRDYGEGYPFILRCSPKGELLWQKRFGEEGNYLPGPMKVDSVGNIYVAGDFDQVQSERRQVFVLKLSKDGELSWARSWSAKGGCYATGLCMDKDGGVFIVGNCIETSAVFLLRYSAEGDLLWTKSWDLGQYGYASAVAQDRSGEIIIAGSHRVITKPDDAADVALIIKLTSKGELLWTRSLVVTPPKEYGSVSIEATSLATDNESNIYFGGREAYKLLLVKLSPNGGILWQTTWSDEDTYLSGLSLSSDSVYVLISRSSDIGSSYIDLLKYSQTGVLQWQAALSTNSNALNASSTCPGYSCIAIDDTGGVYLSWLGSPSSVCWVKREGWIDTWPLEAVNDSLKGTAVTGNAGTISPTLYSPKPTGRWRFGRERFMLGKVNTLSWDVKDPPAHPPQQLRAMAVSPGEIELTWGTADKGGLGYIIERRSASSGGWEEVSRAYTAKSYSDTSVQAQLTYTYRIKSFNSAGESPYSLEASATTFSNPDKPPRGVEWIRCVYIGDHGELSACAAGGNGDLVIAGTASDGLVVAKYAPDGKVKWIRKYKSDKVVKNLFGVSRIALDGSGNIIVAGAYGLSHERDDALTMKLSSYGELLWCKGWGSEYDDNISGVGTDGKGNVYVAGGTVGFNSQSAQMSHRASAFLLKYSPEGELQWDTVYGEDLTDTRANGLYVRQDGHAFIVGGYMPVHYDDEGGPLLAEFTPEGKIASSRYWKCEDSGEFDFIAPAGNDMYFLYGVLHSKNGAQSYPLVLKYSLGKGNIWGKSFIMEGEAPQNYPSPSGLLFASGYRQPSFLQLSPNGELKSAIQFSVSPDFSMSYFAEGKPGELYLIGNSELIYLGAHRIETSYENWDRATYTPSWPRVTQNNQDTDEYSVKLLPSTVKSETPLNCYVMKLNYPELLLGVQGER